jgi:hypothetical protein
MPTVLDLYADSLAEVGRLEPSQTPSGSTVAYIHRAFQDMVRAWSSIRLRQDFIPEETYLLQPGKGTYAIGPGAADFDTTGGSYIRPVFVQTAQIIVGTARRVPMNILSRPQWQLDPLRNLTDPDGPVDFFYDDNRPIATFNVAAKPGGTQVMILSQWNPLKLFAAGDEGLNVEDFYPQHYIPALRLGLAVQLCDSYKMQVTQSLLGRFQVAIAVVESMNQDAMTGALGFTRTLSGPTKGESGILPGNSPQQQQTQQGQ